MTQPTAIARWGLVLCLLGALGRPAFAQKLEPSAGDRAVALGNEGIELFERAQWGDALQRFRDAEALYHSPVFVVFIARGLRAQGRLLEAQAEYQRVLGENLASDAVEPWKRAQAEAKQELAALKQEIPRVAVVLQGAPADAVITLDGRSVRPELGTEVDPGAHSIEVRAGAQRAHREIKVAAGDGDIRVAIEITQPRAEAPAQTHTPTPAAVAQPAREPLATQPATAGDSGPSTVGLVVTALGGAALVTGSVFGVLALKKKSDNERNLPDSCRGTLCPESERAGIEAANEDAKRLGKTADILFLSGAVLTTVGVGLLVLDVGDSTSLEVGIAPRSGFAKYRF